MISKFALSLSALFLGFCIGGCDSGGSSPEVTTNQSELEAFLEANPDAEAGIDTGEEEEADE
tara:strand:- start:136523 stop:136708 length:186 start_codon:yes stop_codon:yes gene_type:complete